MSIPLFTADENPTMSAFNSRITAANNAIYNILPTKTITDVAVASFTDGAGGIPVKALTVDISYTAAGLTGLSITRCAKNLVDFTGSDPTWNTSSQYAQATNGTNALLKVALSKMPFGVRLFPNYDYYRDGELVSREALIYYYNGSTSVAQLRNSDGGIIPVGAVYDRMRLYGTSETVTKVIKNIRLGISQADVATYEAYNGDTYAIDWASIAGTIYGGTLDVVNGVLTSTIDADGNPLAAPVTYNITPVEVTTLYGVNNIYADVGNITLTYRADIGLLIGG